MQVQLEVVEQVELVELHIHKGQQLIMALAGGAGGGGSGFVCTATARPSSGYYVDSKYNLTNATTYAGSSSFTSTSGGTETGHSGNGYAKITLVSGTTTKKVPANKIVTGIRWKGILETANFDYGDKIIRETDSKNNVLEHKKINSVEYIESTGTQWIDTNIYPTSQTTVKIKFNMTAPTGGIIVGFYNNEGDSFRFFNYSNNAYLDYGSGAGYNRINGGTVASGTIYNIEFGNRYVKNIDTNTNIISGTAVSFSDKTTSIGVFGDSTDQDKASGKIYYLKIYINNILARDFIPVLDSNNVPCLYDKISKTYFYNSGTGVFNYK